jgi:hypothetical protein
VTAVAAGPYETGDIARSVAGHGLVSGRERVRRSEDEVTMNTGTLLRLALVAVAPLLGAGQCQTDYPPVPETSQALIGDLAGLLQCGAAANSATTMLPR